MEISNLETRFMTIEMALSNQERVIEDLNQMVISQGRDIDRLKKQNSYLMELAGEDRVKPLSEETPPPHY